MNYGKPDSVNICRCRDNRASPMFCITGHVTECHYPLTCGQAACNHLHKYDETGELDMPAAEQEAINRLASLSNRYCPDCGGAGVTDQEEPLGFDVPEDFRHILGDNPTFTTKVICPCVLPGRTQL